MFSPIEQFTVIPLIEISNFSVTLLIILFSIYMYSNISSYLSYKHIEYWYYNLINKEKGIIFIILTIWLIILMSNIIGMIPYSFTLTAQVLLVLCISVPTFISINIMGIYHHQFNITYLILPAGAPIYLTPLIASIELIAYFIRLISLTLRLAVNLLSGHILLKIILYSLLTLPFNLLIAIIIVPIVLLELLVAFIQAYVFLLLLISYYQDIVLPH